MRNSVLTETSNRLILAVIPLLMFVFFGSHLFGRNAVDDKKGVIEQVIAEYHLAVYVERKNGKLIIRRVFRDRNGNSKREIDDLGSSPYMELMRQTKTSGCLVLVRAAGGENGFTGSSKLCPIKSDVLTYKEKKYIWSREIEKFDARQGKKKDQSVK